MRDYLVLDIEIPPFLGNRILDRDYALRFPGASVFSSLADLARSRGWRVSTADVFISERPTFDSAAMVSNEFTPFLPTLLERGVSPALLVSGESPAIAGAFYKDLPRRSGIFRHAYLFRGCLRRLSRNVVGHPWLWPCPPTRGTGQTPWADRRLLGMVAGFKGVWCGPRAAAKNLPSTIRTAWDTLRDPSLSGRDLYDLRWQAVRTFSSRSDFVLRGQGWEHTTREGCRWFRTPLDYANAPTPCDDKLAVLGECRFGLAFENVVYPGYVTEKLFDVLRAGAVPIYMGAPDIAELVPAGCFVDYRDFGSLEVLWNHLEGMSEARWRIYRSEGEAFLASGQYERHLDRNVAKQWLEWIEESKLC